MVRYATGFVSNSSSSTYVCSYCGSGESAYEESNSSIKSCKASTNHEYCTDPHHDTVTSVWSDALEYVELWDILILLRWERYTAKAQRREERSWESVLRCVTPDMVERITQAHPALFEDITDSNARKLLVDEFEIDSECPICTNRLILDRAIIRHYEHITGIPKDKVEHRVARKRYEPLAEKRARKRRRLNYEHHRSGYCTA